MTTRANRGIYRRFQSEPFNKMAYEVMHFRQTYDTEAPYQRGGVWGVDRQRRLIESMMLGIPIGSLILNRRPFANDPSGRWVVVDGKQRLGALWDFVDDKYGVPTEWFGIGGSWSLGRAVLGETA